MATTTDQPLRFTLTTHAEGWCLTAQRRRTDGVWYGVDWEVGPDIATVYQRLRANLRADGFVLNPVVLMRGAEPSHPFSGNQLLRQIRRQADLMAEVLAPPEAEELATA